MQNFMIKLYISWQTVCFLDKLLINYLFGAKFQDKLLDSPIVMSLSV